LRNPQAKIHPWEGRGRCDPERAMDVIIYGLVGHAGSLRIPLEELDLDDLTAGREFTYQGKIYEIRSVQEAENALHMNVVMIMEESQA
jgi:predicted metal-dependent peptidase